MADSMTNAEARMREGMKRVTRLLSRIAEIGEPSESPDGMSAIEIAAVVRQINQEYGENTRLAASEQIPFFVFERIIDVLGRRLERVTSTELLAALRELPHGIANADIIRQQTRLLLRNYNEHLVRHPMDANVRVARATLNLAERRFEAVLEDCAVLRDSTPTPDETYRLEVEALLGLKQYERAYERLERMLNADTNDLFALYQRGQLHATFGYAAEALTDAERLVESSEPAHVLWCAGLYLSENRAADAIQACKKVLARAPHDPESLFLLGEAQFCSRVWERSRQTFAAFLDASEPEKDDPSWRRKRYFAIRRMADVDQQMQNYEKALDGYGWLLSTGEYDYWAMRSYIKISERCIRGKLRRDFEKKPAGAPRTEASETIPPSAVDVTRAEANMDIEWGEGGARRIRIIDPETIVYLERLSWSDTVEELELLELNRDNRAAFTALFELRMPKLRSLLVRAERFGYACARKLIEAPFFHDLEALSLVRCNLYAPALELIAAHLPPRLKELGLAHNADVHELPFPHRFPKLLAESSVSPQLRALDLTDCGLDGDDVEILLASEWRSLRSLKIGANELQGLEVERFLEIPVISRLRELRIGHSGIEKQMLFAILDRLPDMELERIGLEGDWTDAELRAAVAHRHFGDVAYLDLGMSHISDVGWQTLLESLQ